MRLVWAMPDPQGMTQLLAALEEVRGVDDRSVEVLAEGMIEIDADFGRPFIRLNRVVVLEIVGRN